MEELDYWDNGQQPVIPSGCEQFNITFSRVHLLHSNHLIAWPNFSHCLPQCGMCQVVASDPTYIVYNLLLIGFILPFIGLCGLLGNGMSAFIYYRPGDTFFAIIIFIKIFMLYLFDYRYLIEFF